jgi:hypothetical protein
VAAAGTETDDADLAGGIRLRAQIGHRAGNVAHDLCIGHAAGGADAGAEVVGRLDGIAFAEIKVWRDRRVTVMGELAHDLGGPLAPARDVMDDDDAGEFSRPGRLCVIGLALVAIMAAERHHFRMQTLVETHAPLPCSWVFGRYR